MRWRAGRAQSTGLMGSIRGKAKAEVMTLDLPSAVLVLSSCQLEAPRPAWQGYQLVLPPTGRLRIDEPCGGGWSRWSLGSYTHHPGDSGT